MDEIERALREQIAYGPSRSPVSPEKAVDAGRESARIRLLIALTEDEALQAAWARSTDFTNQDLFGRAAWLQAEIEAVDERVDELLAHDASNGVLELLARCEIPWRHDAIGSALTDEPAEASLVLARAAPGELRRHLIGCEVLEDVVLVLRAAAVAGAERLWDQFLIWRDRIEELEELESSERRAWLRRLDGCAAALDPTLYARGLLAGDYGTEWLREPTAVADFLQIYGPTDWLEVVSAIEIAEDGPYELAATVAVAAAQGVGGEPPDETEVQRLLDLLGESIEPHQKERPWESLAARSGLGFSMALAGDEEEFGLLLAQVAAHERLVTHGVHSPGVRGLPLSATSPDDLDSDRALELVGEMAGGLRDSESLLLSAVRTLFDAAVWSRREGDDSAELLRSVAETFEKTSHEAVDVARSRLEEELAAATGSIGDGGVDGASALRGALSYGGRSGAEESTASDSAIVETLVSCAARRESPTGLDCVRHLGDVSGSASLEALGRLWLQETPVLRAPFARRVLEESIVVDLPSGDETGE